MPELIVKFSTVQQAHAVAELLREEGARVLNYRGRSTKTLRVQRYGSSFSVTLNYVNYYGLCVVPIKYVLQQLGIQ